MKGYDYYVPFAEDLINFITQIENKEIFIFKKKYKWNSFNNYNPEKYYILLSKDSLSFNSTTNFQFKIFPHTICNSIDPLPFFWIAFGLYIIKNGEKINYNNIYFQDDNFLCIDLDCSFYLKGKKNYK